MQRTHSEAINPVDIREYGAKFFADLHEKAQRGTGTPEMCMAAVAVGLTLIGEIDRLRTLIEGEDRTLP